MSYVVTCTSTIDMPREFFEKRDLPFAMFHYSMDGREYPDDLGKSMPFSDFYRRIKEGAMPTTSQVNEDQFKQLWEKYLSNDQDVIHFSLSSGISGEYNSACAARDLLKSAYPERKIYVVDTLAASMGYGLLMDAVLDRRDEGMDIDSLRSWTEEHKLELNHWFFTSDLTHLRRGGRVSRTSAVFGTLLDICPLMNVSFEGKLVAREKIRSKKKVIQAAFKKMVSLARNGTEYSGKCFICNSDCFDDARALADLIEGTFKNLSAPVLINSIGTVIGSHTGPGTVAVFFWGERRAD